MSLGETFMQERRSQVKHSVQQQLQSMHLLCIIIKTAYNSRQFSCVHKKSPPNRTLHIITYVGFSLSIIALLFLLMTYFLFAELRTYPGKMVMHLSCAMIAMQSVYFAADPGVVSSAVCAVMGALYHYFILAVFYG